MDVISVNDLYWRLIGKYQPLPNPAVEIEGLVNELSSRGLRAGMAGVEVQAAVTELTRSVVAQLVGVYGKWLDRGILERLSIIHEAVAVVVNLTDLLARRTPGVHAPPVSLERLALNFVPARWIIDIDGLVHTGFWAVVFSPHVFKGGPKHTVAHEILHRASNGNLPEWLEEAAVDYFAWKLFPDGHKPWLRMGNAYRVAYTVWLLVVAIVGEEWAFKLLTDGAVVETTVYRGHVLYTRLVGHPAHDRLRAQLGRGWLGVNLWDVILFLIERKIMFPVQFLLRPNLSAIQLG